MTRPTKAVKTYDMERIVDQIRRSFEGGAWHGPSVMESVSGVTAAQAAAKPLPGGHSIWEIFLHTGFWIDAVRRRLSGQVVGSVPPIEENFPSPSEVSEATWQQAQAKVFSAYRSLMKTLEETPEAQLRDSVPGKKSNFYFELTGLPQHNAYHAGQIVLLRK